MQLNAPSPRNSFYQTSKLNVKTFNQKEKEENLFTKYSLSWVNNKKKQKIHKPLTWLRLILQGWGTQILFLVTGRMVRRGHPKSTPLVPGTENFSYCGQNVVYHLSVFLNNPAEQCTQSGILSLYESLLMAASGWWVYDEAADPGDIDSLLHFHPLP